MESYGQQRSCDSRAPLGSRRSCGLTRHSLACNCRAHAPKLDLLYYSLRRSTTFGHSIHFSTLRIFGVFNTLFKPGQFQVPKSSSNLLECTHLWVNASLSARLFEHSLIWVHSSLSALRFESTQIWAHSDLSALRFERTQIWAHSILNALLFERALFNPTHALVSAGFFKRKLFWVHAYLQISVARSCKIRHFEWFSPKIEFFGSLPFCKHVIYHSFFLSGFAGLPEELPSNSTPCSFRPVSTHTGIVARPS